MMSNGTAGPVAVVLETPRLWMRWMTPADFPALCTILQDPAVMYAYEHAFSDAEVQDWLDRQLARYEASGRRYGLWGVIAKEDGAFIGQCGLTMQDCGDREELEVGYLFRRNHWHRGYATEAARACRDYAFATLGAEQVVSIIRENNLASRAVAERNGMVPTGQLVKHYYGMDMPHLIYTIRRADWQERQRLDFGQMQAMQRQLQEKYRDKWGGLPPEKAIQQLLWMLIEAGEMADIIKKEGHQQILDHVATRQHFIEETCDVLMYLNDVLLCYHITPEELAAVYRQKHRRNMTRWES